MPIFRALHRALRPQKMERLRRQDPSLPPSLFLSIFTFGYFHFHLRKNVFDCGGVRLTFCVLFVTRVRVFIYVFGL